MGDAGLRRVDEIPRTHSPIVSSATMRRMAREPSSAALGKPPWEERRIVHSGVRRQLLLRTPTAARSSTCRFSCPVPQSNRRTCHLKFPHWDGTFLAATLL